MDIQTILFAPEWAFLRFALLVGILISPALGVIGTLVVTRRISSLAGASAHAALGGFGLALFLQRACGLAFITAAAGAMFGALAAALTVGVVSICAKEREDTVIGAVWAIGMSVGLLFLDHTPGYVDWQSYLFGNILLLSKHDLILTILLDIAVLVPTVLFFPQLLAMLFDGTYAALRGVKNNLIYLVMLAMTALMVIQQRMTPMSMDPAQKKMMVMMPVIMLLFLYDLPSGLTLYWTVSNLFSILQLWLQKRRGQNSDAAKPQTQGN